MTYEMAVAKALLKATGSSVEGSPSRPAYRIRTEIGAYVEKYGCNLAKRTYAMRRLRVRAGLTP